MNHSADLPHYLRCPLKFLNCLVPGYAWVVNHVLISMISWGCSLLTNHVDLLTSCGTSLAKVTCHGGSRTEDLQAATESAQGQAGVVAVQRFLCP